MGSPPVPLPTEHEANLQHSAGSSKVYLLFALGSGLIVTALSLALFGASGRDDPYITFSAAEAIVHNGRLANINGDAIEQSTTLLLTLLLAGLYWLTGISTPLLGWIVSFAALAAITPTAYLILRRSLSDSRALIGAVIASMTPPLVYWAASGAEQSLAILLTLVLVILMDRLADERGSWWLISAAAVISAMVFLTRPDLGLSAFAATGVLAVLALVTRRYSLSQRLGALAGSQVVLILAISLARVSTTGSAPQPLGAKVGTNLIEQISRGVSYVITNALSPWFVVVVIVAAVILWRARPRSVPVGISFLFLNAVAILAGTTLSGGDWMELGRFFAAPATFLVIAVMSLTQQLSVRAFGAVSTILLVSPIATMILWSTAPTAVEARGSNIFNRWVLETTGSPGVPETLSNPFNRWNADHLGDSYFLGAAVPEVAKVLATDPARQFTITSGQGGLIPYVLRREFGDQIRFIDRFQLMTDDFADCDLRAGTYGSFISWNQWLDFAGECAPELPDMVFSIGSIPQDDLSDDYAVVVHVEGAAAQGTGSLSQEQWLAVKREYVTHP